MNASRSIARSLFKAIAASLFMLAAAVLMMPLTAAAQDTAPMYRLYNRWTGEHFYTASAYERDSLSSVGWDYEGVGWTAPASGDPVHRLYNPFAPGGDHHYTTSARERDALVAEGWSYEGVGWRSAAGGADRVPLYRQYNPYASTGTHNYTASLYENDHLVSLGWREEGIAWYGVSSTSEPNAITRAEWIRMLVEGTNTPLVEETEDSPYSDIAESEYERHIITAYRANALYGIKGTFSPDDPATREFAAVSAARLAGYFDDGTELDVPDASEASEPSMLVVALDIGLLEPDASGNIDPKGSLSKDEAQAIVDSLNALLEEESFGGNHTIVDVHDDVTLIDDYTVSDSGFVLGEDAPDLSLGSKVVLQPSSDNASGSLGTVLSSSESADGNRVITVQDDDEFGDYLKSIDIVETDAKIDASAFVPVEGVEVASPSDPEAGAGGSDDSLTLKVNIKEDGLSVNGSLTIDPDVDFVFKMGWDWLVPHVDRFKLEVSSEVTANIDVEVSGKKEIKLNKKPIPLGQFVTVDLYFVVDADGTLGVEAKYSQVAGVKYPYGKKETLHPYAKSDVDLSVEAEMEVKTGVEMSPAAAVFGKPVYDLTVGIGGDGVASVTVRDTGMTCNDFDIYAYLEVSAGTKENVFKYIGLKATFSKELWDEDSSPFSWSWHFEDGELVDECTYDDGLDDGSEDGPDQSSGVTEDGLMYLIDTSDYGYGVYITGYSGSSTTVRIPHTINGVEVVSVEITGGENYPTLYIDLSGAKALKSFYIFTTVQTKAQVEFGTLNNLVNVETQVYSKIVGDFDMSSCLNLAHIGIGDGTTFGSSFRFSSTNLETLAIGYSNFTGTFSIGDAPKLKKLMISGSPITSLKLGSCPNLEELYISETQITELDISAFPKLVTLYCVANRIDDLSALESWLAQPGHSGKVGASWN